MNQEGMMGVSELIHHVQSFRLHAVIGTRRVHCGIILIV
jgi:hypothetical protein